MIEYDLFWCESPLVAKRFQIIKTCFTEVAIRSAAIISYLPKHKAKNRLKQKSIQNFFLF